MPRKSTRRGTPAHLVLADGLSRHGRHCSCQICRAEYAAAPVLAGYNRISHAAHYMCGTGGHDLDRWVVRCEVQPSGEQVSALGVASDAKYHSGYIHNEQQHWIYTAIRPLSVGVACPTCDAVEMQRETDGFRAVDDLAEAVRG